VLKGRTLQKERRRLFTDEPLCVECLKVGRDSIAVIRDHIIPLAEGGQDIPSNTQGLCEYCHTEKSKKEAQRGRR
jgi:5-methylcytosine-specific restriction protein A